jgi:biopolymer transport protein TolR
MSEINVTPFVDVMLVLLIIFMVAAPILTVGVPLDLPETLRQRAEFGHPADHRIGEPGGARSSCRIREVTVRGDRRGSRPSRTTGYEERIYVRGDQNADYGTVMRVMSRIRRGLQQYGIRDASGNGTTDRQR